MKEPTTEQLKSQLAISDKVIEKMQIQLGKNEGHIARLEVINEGLKRANKDLSDSLAEIEKLKDKQDTKK